MSKKEMKCTLKKFELNNSPIVAPTVYITFEFDFGEFTQEIKFGGYLHLTEASPLNEKVFKCPKKK